MNPSPCEPGEQLPQLELGEHELRVTAEDAAGNVSPVASSRFSIVAPAVDAAAVRRVDTPPVVSPPAPTPSPVPTPSSAPAPAPAGASPVTAAGQPPRATNIRVRLSRKRERRLTVAFDAPADARVAAISLRRGKGSTSPRVAARRRTVRPGARNSISFRLEPRGAGAASSRLPVRHRYAGERHWNAGHAADTLPARHPSLTQRFIRHICGSSSSSSWSPSSPAALWGYASQGGQTDPPPTPEISPEPTPAASPSPAPARGARAAFVETCGMCHALQAAGTHGFVGPDLDETKPSRARVRRMIRTGSIDGIMQPGLLEGRDARAVASYVARVAG